jgi:hypothetical protein
MDGRSADDGADSMGSRRSGVFSTMPMAAATEATGGFGAGDGM